LQAAVGVLLGDGDNQTQVRFNHLFLRAAGLGLTDRHATVDVLDFGNRQAGFGLKRGQLVLATNDVRLQATDGFGVFRLALGQCIGPALVDFIARELAQEVGARHACITYTQLHDCPFLCTQTLESAANAFNQAFELLRHQLDRHEQLGQRHQLGNCQLVGATVLFQDLARDFHLIGNRTETLGSDDRVWTAFDFVFVVGAGFSVVVFGVVVRFHGFRVDRRRYFGGRRRNAVVRVDIATQDVGQAATFGGDASVLGENVVNRAREVRNGAHHFTDTLFDTLGDFDFAFACQQLDGTHFTHIHTHRVSRATDVGLYRCQRGSGFFSGCLVGIGVGQHKGVRIRSTLVYGDPHVVNHADDVFHLLWI